MMEDDNIFLDNGEPNYELANTCNNLFYGSTELAGNIGVKNLGYIVSAPEQEFQAYLDATAPQQYQDDGLSQ